MSRRLKNWNCKDNFADTWIAAREIQSQLLKDFSTKSSLSDWFDRVRKGRGNGQSNLELTLGADGRASQTIPAESESEKSGKPSEDRRARRATRAVHCPCPNPTSKLEKSHS